MRSQSPNDINGGEQRVVRLDKEQSPEPGSGRTKDSHDLNQGCLEGPSYFRKTHTLVVLILIVWWKVEVVDYDQTVDKCQTG